MEPQAASGAMPIKMYMATKSGATKNSKVAAPIVTSLPMNNSEMIGKPKLPQNIATKSAMNMTLLSTNIVSRLRMLAN